MTDDDQKVRELIKQIATEQGITNYNVTIIPTSSGGANYTSKLFIVTITGDTELKLFAKVAAFGEKARKDIPNTIYNTEWYFYSTLRKIYKDLEVQFHVPEEHKLSFTKLYGCNINYLEETFVLEDLGHQGFKDYSRLVSIDWPYAESAIRELAKLHAFSHAYKKHNPKEFQRTVEILKFDWTMTDEQLEVFWGRGSRMAINEANIENKERVEDYLKDNMFIYNSFLAPVDTTVLIHADYRVSNQLHKYNDDGTVSIKIVDYQTLHGGCPMSDFVYFLITGTDADFRQQHFQRLVDHYYKELCAALRRLNTDPEEVYTREMFEHELKEKLRFAFQVAVFALPLLTIQSEDVPEVDQNFDFSSLAAAKTEHSYRVRLNGIVDDCIRWGVL